MGIFKLDSPIMKFLTRMADLMILNVLGIVCCLPVITIGASLTATHYISLKLIRGEEGYIVRGFFESFKENFKQATIVWMIIIAVALLVAGDILIINNSGIEFHVVLKTVIIIAGVLIACTFLYVFAILAKFDNTIMNTIKNALFMSLHQFPKTVLMVVFHVVPPAAFILIPQSIPVVLMFGFILPVYLSALLYNKFFRKLEGRIEKATAGSEDGETAGGIEEQEDERIFHDELNPSLADREIS